MEIFKRAGYDSGVLAVRERINDAVGYRQNCIHLARAFRHADTRMLPKLLDWVEEIVSLDVVPNIELPGTIVGMQMADGLIYTIPVDRIENETGRGWYFAGLGSDAFESVYLPSRSLPAVLQLGWHAYRQILREIKPQIEQLSSHHMRQIQVPYESVPAMQEKLGRLMMGDVIDLSALPDPVEIVFYPYPSFGHWAGEPAIVA